MNTDALIEAGLTTEQAKVYACLLENGLMPAKVISTKAAIGRSLTYKILGQLIELKLVEERTNIGKISFFYPGHPKTIKDLAERRKMSSAQAFEFVN
jgi:sugar-specific transcriptional regulator TrmB